MIPVHISRSILEMCRLARTLNLTCLCEFPGDDEKKKRQERLKKNRHSVSSVSSKTCESLQTSDNEMTSEMVSLSGGDVGALSTPIVVLPDSDATSVPTVHVSETTLPAVSACELNRETTNLLSTSKLSRLDKDGLSSTLPVDLLSVIENSINASVTSTLTADGPDLMRPLTTDEEQVLQELVQVDILLILRRLTTFVLNFFATVISNNTD